MTPVEEMFAAASKLRDAAKDAADGPWTASPVWSPRSHATSAVYSSAYPTGTADSEIAASGLISRRQGGIRRPGNAVWIALVHPGLADPLAAWLEREAIWANIGGIPRDLEALAVARMINGAVSDHARSETANAHPHPNH